MTRVLVTGGRDFADWETLREALDRLHAGLITPSFTDTSTTIPRPITCVISGGARGADELAIRWAMLNQVNFLVFPADWKTHGRAAGPIRNREMLVRGNPDVVLAFAGGAGTADMVKAARQAGVKVITAVELLAGGTK